MRRCPWLCPYYRDGNQVADLPINYGKPPPYKFVKGGIVHNPPGILHAMRGTSVPLLAIWFLLPT